jgi:hypothetical protein
MKKIVIILLMTIACNSYGQKMYNMDSKKSNFPMFILTKDSAIYKGVKYGVYQDRRSHLFIWYTNSRGRMVKRYIY